MKTLKRIGATIIGSFEAVVNQVENHEALVNGAIREVQENSARAKAQLNRVRQDGQNMRKRLSELQEQSELWQQRAVKSAASEEQKALECLKRKRLLQKRISGLEIQEREHSRLEKQLSSDLQLMDDKISSLKQQRNIMRTRQSRADTIKLLQSGDSALVTEIDEIFERWEIKVGEYDNYSTFNPASADLLAEEYELNEEEASLKEELNLLIKSGAQN